MENREILITGYADVPQGNAASELYTTIALGLVVDRLTGEILDVDCSLVTQIARDFVKQLVLHKNLNELELIEEAFNTRYFGSARKALIMAVRICSEKFRRIGADDEILD